MKFLFSLIKKFIFLILLVILHFFISYLFPFPLNTLNILFVALLLLMIRSESGGVIWMTFFTHFFIELYSASFFGLILFSGTMSILLTFWFLKYFFTNRSLYAALFLTIIALFLYRTMFLSLLAFTNFFTTRESIPWATVFPLYGWEMIFTLLFVAIGYSFIFKLGGRKKRKKAVFL